MTKQHVFGKRLLAFLDDRTEGHYFELDTTLLRRITTKKKSGNIWSRRLRRVCSNCNGGWMRQLEESSFSVLSGLMIGETLISAADIKVLSARPAQMIMMADLSI